jgi:hypothetical protein
MHLGIPLAIRRSFAPPVPCQATRQNGSASDWISMLQGRPRRLSHVGAASLRGSLASVDQSHHVIYGQNLWSKGSATARRPRQRAGSRDRGRQSAGRSQTKMYYSGRVSANRTDQELSASAPIFLALKAIRTYIFEHLGILIIRPAVQNLVRGVDLKPNCPLSDAPYIVLSHDNGSIKVRRACDSIGRRLNSRRTGFAKEVHEKGRRHIDSVMACR